MSNSWENFLQTRQALLDATAHNLVAFGSAQKESELAATKTILVPLLHLGLIQVEGDDAATFLHNLVSNDIQSLSLGRAQYNSLNSPKGRMLASFVVWRTETGFSLLISADTLPGTLKKLSMYVLRSKVKLSNAEDARKTIGLSGPLAEKCLETAGLTAPKNELDTTQEEVRVIKLGGARYLIDSPTELAPELWKKLNAAGASEAGTAAWRWLDIQAGIPVITAQTQDEFVAQMVNFEVLGGVSFKKGCYPGQEIIARTQYLGKLKKRMFRAHLAETNTIAIGSDLFTPEFGAQSCGKIIAAETSPEGGTDVLAVMQISAFESGEVHLDSIDGPLLNLRTLPYAID